jgi:cell division protein FtsB
VVVCHGCKAASIGKVIVCTREEPQRGRTPEAMAAYAREVRKLADQKRSEIESLSRRLVVIEEEAQRLEDELRDEPTPAIVLTGPVANSQTRDIDMLRAENEALHEHIETLCAGIDSFQVDHPTPWDVAMEEHGDGRAEWVIEDSQGSRVYGYFYDGDGEAEDSARHDVNAVNKAAELAQELGLLRAKYRARMTP